MSLEDAIEHMQDLLGNARRSREKKIYRSFVQLLQNLQAHSLTEEERAAISTKLDSLELESVHPHPARHYRRALQNFTQYLKEAFSLVPKGYYTQLGVGLGTTFGMLFGIVVLGNLERSMGIALGLGFGTMIGLVIGSRMDAQVAQQNRAI